MILWMNDMIPCFSRRMIDILIADRAPSYSYSGIILLKWSDNAWNPNTVDTQARLRVMGGGDHQYE